MRSYASLQALIQEVVESFFQTFPALHQRFIARLRSIADAL